MLITKRKSTKSSPCDRTYSNEVGSCLESWERNPPNLMMALPSQINVRYLNNPSLSVNKNKNQYQTEFRIYIFLINNLYLSKLYNSTV